MSNDSKLLLGLILGVVAGGTAAILLAPESGKETRNKLKNTIDNFKDEIDEKLSKLSEKIDNETVEGIKDQFKDSKQAIVNEYKSLTKKLSDLEQEIELKASKLKENL